MIISIAVSCVIFAAILCFAVRILSEAGVPLPQNSVTGFLTADKSPARLDEQNEKYELLKIFIYAFIFRLIIFVLGWASCGIFDSSTVPSFLEYCEKWSLWDSPHYIEIAQYGYAHHIEDGQYLFLVFFPLYPLMMRIFAMIVQNYFIAGLLVSFLSYSFGCVLMYRLVNIDYSRDIARRSVLLLSVSPFAFFFGGIMTEGLFFLIIMAAFLAIRTHKWLLAGILGALAALSRSFGVFMIIAAAVEWVQYERPVKLIREKHFKELGKKFTRTLPILIMPVGTLIYLFINYRVAGDAFIFLQYDKEHWSQSIQFFGKTLNMLSSRAFSSTESWTYIVSMFLSGLVSAAAGAVMILLGMRRTRSMYSAFMLMYFFFNAGASWPLSLNRYMACMFPAFWVLAALTDKRREFGTLITAVMAVAFGIFMTGYLTVHSIM